jgi:hypothetical protein
LKQQKNNNKDYRLFDSRTSDEYVDLLGEQIGELRDGIKSFQTEAYESIYAKPVPWSKEKNLAESTKKGEEIDETPNTEKLVSNEASSEAPSVRVEETIEAIAPESIETPAPEKPISDVQEAPTRPKAKPAPKKIEPTPVLSEMALKEAFVKAIPAVVNSPPDEVDGIVLKDVAIVKKEETDEEKVKKSILRAQQSVSKSFLAYGENFSTVSLIVSP